MVLRGRMNRMTEQMNGFASLMYTKLQEHAQTQKTLYEQTRQGFDSWRARVEGLEQVVGSIRGSIPASSAYDGGTKWPKVFS